MFKKTIFVFSFFALPFFALAQVGDTLPQQTDGECLNLSNSMYYRSVDTRTNGEVSLLQDFLQSNGYLNSEPTGFFGTLTLGAAKVFQGRVLSGVSASDIDSRLVPDPVIRQRLAENGFVLGQNGYVGAYTRAKIRYLTCTANGVAQNIQNTNNQTQTIQPQSKTQTQTQQTTDTSSISAIIGCRTGYLFNSMTGQPCPSLQVTQNTQTSPAPTTGSLSVGVGVTPSPQTIVGGTQGAIFATYQLNATQSSEGLRVSPLYLNLTLGGGARAQDLTYCQLVDGATVLNTGPSVVNPQSGGISAFSFDYMLTIVKGTIKTLSLKCNVSSQAAPGATYAWGLSGTSVANVVGVSTSNNINETVTPSIGSTMTISSTGAGSLTVSNSPTSPAFQTVPGGSVGVLMGVMRFSATNEAISLQRIGLKLTSGSPQDIAGVTLWDGGTQIGTAIFAAGSNRATSALVSPLNIPRDSDKNITIKVNLNPVGTGQATAGNIVKIDFNNIDSGITFGTGQNSGTSIYASGSTYFQGVQISSTSAISPAPTVIKNLTASPATITAGQTAVLSWEILNASSCTASGSSQFSGTKGTLSTYYPVTPTQTTTYTLTCGSLSPQTVTVTVNQTQTSPAPTINYFTVSPNPHQISQSYSQISLSWSANNATSCTLNGQSYGSSGTVYVTASNSDQTYTVSCTGPGGTAAKGVVANVVQTTLAPSISSFSASPTSITSGQSSTLSWSASNASSCVASGGWGGSLSLSGQQTLSPTQTTTYTITCSSSIGSTNKSVSVSVSQPNTIPPTLDFTINNSSSAVYDSNSFSSSWMYLRWSSTNASSCVASGDWTGSKILNNSTGESVYTTKASTYTLTCSNSAGSASKSVNVTVSSAAPAVTFSASPTSVTEGSPVTLTWSSTNNAASCYASGQSGWQGNKTPSGSATVYPTQTGNTYFLSCSNSSGTSNTASVSINVAPPASTDKPIVSFFISKNFLINNETSNITISPTENFFIQVTGTNSPSECYRSIKLDVYAGNDWGPWVQFTCSLYNFSTGMNASTFGFAPGTTNGIAIYMKNSVGASANVARFITVSSPTSFNSSGSQTASAIASLFKPVNGNESTSAKFSYVWDHDLQIGSPRSFDVSALQFALSIEGVYGGEITGGFYTQTYSAVKEFQKKYGIDATGFFGPLTRSKLNELYKK